MAKYNHFEKVCIVENAIECVEVLSESLYQTFVKENAEIVKQAEKSNWYEVSDTSLDEIIQWFLNTGFLEEADLSDMNYQYHYHEFP